MIITCPACESRYVVNPEQLGSAKRKVRCARCKHVWEVECTPSIAELKTERTPLPANPPQPRSYAWGWGIGIVILATLVLTLSLGRHTIVNQWPAFSQLYRTLGCPITTPGEGLEVLETEAVISQESEAIPQKISIRGRVYNSSAQTQFVPPVRISLEGPCPDDEQKRCILQRWEHQFAHSRLLPKESIHFETEEPLTALKPDKIIVGF